MIMVELSRLLTYLYGKVNFFFIDFKKKGK